MNVAYENLRLAPVSESTNELTRYSLEDELYGMNNECDVEQTENIGTLEDSISEDFETETDTDTIMREIFGNEAQHESNKTKSINELFSSNVLGNFSKDVGSTKKCEGFEIAKILSDEQKVLEEVYEVISSDQVTCRYMKCAPQWLVNKEVKTEIDANWTDSYIAILEQNVAVMRI